MFREATGENFSDYKRRTRLERVKWELAHSDPEALHAAPSTTPVGRLDEVDAARNPVLRYQKP